MLPLLTEGKYEQSKNSLPVQLTYDKVSLIICDTLSYGSDEMPSNTFLHLPAPKREKLLKAAREEFARVPFAQASINRIVRAAGIPRGSFYQYFADKEALFRHLIGVFGEQLLATMEALLEKHRGDLFATLLDLFDMIQQDSRHSDSRPIYEGIIRIIQKNQELGHTLMEADHTREETLRRICAKVDGNLLDLRGERDMEDMVLVLSGVTGPAMVEGILSQDPAPVRARYVNQLQILARGMAKHQ